MRALILSLLLAVAAPVFIGAPAQALHNTLPKDHPLYEICRNQHGEDSAAACQDAAREDSEGRIFGPDGVLTTAANLITIITAIAATVVIIVGGIMYALSGGNGEQINRAKNAIIYAAIGLVVAAFGQLIIVFVLNRL